MVNKNEPIKAGDRCIVINALGQSKSPNIGKEVTVVSLQGEHSHVGRIWRCRGDVSQYDDAGNYVKIGWADFAAAWLQKIPKVDKFSGMGHDIIITEEA